MKHIRSIVSVDLAFLKSHPPQLLVSSIGTVNSGGWKNGSLDLRYYIVPPADGIQDIDFVASPPAGPSTAVILPISAQTTIFPIPPWLKGVRVHAETNHVLAETSSSREVLIS